jgi:hypothetical protein
MNLVKCLGAVCEVGLGVQTSSGDEIHRGATVSLFEYTTYTSRPVTTRRTYPLPRPPLPRPQRAFGIFMLIPTRFATLCRQRAGGAGVGARG